MFTQPVNPPGTTEEIDSFFSNGLGHVEVVAGQLHPFGPNPDAPVFSGPPLRIRPYAVSWALEYKDVTGRWIGKAWGKTGAVKPPQPPTRIMSLMAPGAPCKRTAESYDGVPEVTLENKKTFMEGDKSPKGM